MLWSTLRGFKTSKVKNVCRSYKFSIHIFSENIQTSSYPLLSLSLCNKTHKLTASNLIHIKREGDNFIHCCIWLDASCGVMVRRNLRKQTRNTDSMILEDRTHPGTAFLNFRPVSPTVSCQSKHTLLKNVQHLRIVCREHEISWWHAKHIGTGFQWCTKTWNRLTS